MLLQLDDITTTARTLHRQNLYPRAQYPEIRKLPAQTALVLQVFCFQEYSFNNIPVRNTA
jgi:hypothetical protein